MAFGPIVPGSERLVTGAFLETYADSQALVAAETENTWTHMLNYSRPNVLFSRRDNENTTMLR